MAKYLYIVFPMIAAILAVSVVQADSPTEVEGATTIDVATAKTFESAAPTHDPGTKFGRWQTKAFMETIGETGR